VNYERRDFFRERLTSAELRGILEAAGCRPVDILSRRSRAYQSRRGEIDAMSDEQLLDEMTREPTLIRRPLILDGNRLIVGYDTKSLAMLASDQTETEQARC